MRGVDDLITALDDPATTDEAVDALGARGPAVLEQLVVAMLDEARTNKTRELCAQLAGQIVPAGVERLLTLLRSSNGNDADLAAWGLRWNHGAQIAEPALLEMLGSSTDVVRENAARALKYIHVDLCRFDSRILAAAGDSVANVRRDVLRVLIQLTATEPRPVDMMHGQLLAVARRALRDDDPEVRELAQDLMSEVEGC